MKVICVAAVISGEAKNIFHKVFRLVSSEAQIYTAFTYICVYDYSYIIIHIYIIYEKYAVSKIVPYIRLWCVRKIYRYFEKVAYTV